MSSAGNTWGWHGRPPGLTRDMEIRMGRWRRLCESGLKTKEIAREMGLSVKTLQRSVSRARKAGCRDAVIHPLAYDCIPGLSHIYHAPSRASRLRRLRREQETSTA